MFAVPCIADRTLHSCHPAARHMGALKVMVLAKQPFSHFASDPVRLDRRDHFKQGEFLRMASMLKTDGTCQLIH